MKISKEHVDAPTLVHGIVTEYIKKVGVFLLGFLLFLFIIIMGENMIRICAITKQMKYYMMFR